MKSGIYKIDNKKSKKVFQYTKQGKFIKEWKSVKEAESFYGKVYLTVH